MDFVGYSIAKGNILFNGILCNAMRLNGLPHELSHIFIFARLLTSGST